MFRTSIVVFTALISFVALISYSHAQSTGLTFADRATYESIPIASKPLSGTLAKSTDLTENFPKPGNQGQQGSCVGWAISYLKTYQERIERNWDLNSSDHVFSPSYIYNQSKLPGDCSVGTIYPSAFSVLTSDGISPVSQFPYSQNSCTETPSEELKVRSRQYTIDRWRRVNTQDPAELKTHIASGVPVLIGAEVHEAFQSLAKGTVYNKVAGKYLGGHAMVVIGYDDAKNAFKVINSWGSNWADDGYGWIHFDTFKKITREGYVTRDVTAEREPSSDTRPDTGKKNDGSVVFDARAFQIDRAPTYQFVLTIKAAADGKQITSATYTLNHPSLNYVKLASKTSNDGFAVGYTGWGCLQSVLVDVTYSDGSTKQHDFNMCDAMEGSK